MNRKKTIITAFLLVFALILVRPMSASADWRSWFNLKGSLGENGHTRYVAPIASPFFNETPQITTEVRVQYFYQEVPNTAFTGVGHANAVAAQIRIAITERLGFIATKDGYVNLNFKDIPDTTGTENIAFGFKYALLSDPVSGRILTVGLRFEVPTGTLETARITLQGGKSSGFTDIFLTGATNIGDRMGLQTSFGFNLANDGGHDSSLIHYGIHVDYELMPNLFPLLELNGTSTINDGDRTGVFQEGGDLFNVGAIDSGHLATLNAGARYMLGDHIQVGAGYEFPVTSRQDLFKWRATFDLTLVY